MLALDYDRRCRLVIAPDADIDAVVFTPRTELDPKSFLRKVLGSEALELSPVDLGDVAEVAVQVVDEPLIEEFAVGHEVLALEEFFQIHDVLPGIRLPTGGACPLNYACLYQNANRRGVGIGALIGFGFSNLHSVSCPTCTNGVHGNDGTFNDQMTSWENQSGTRYCWGVNASTHPTDHIMGDGDVTNVPANENDTASSFFPC